MCLSVKSAKSAVEIGFTLFSVLHAQPPWQSHRHSKLIPSRRRQFVETHGNRRLFDAITGGDGNLVLPVDVADSLMPDTKTVLADWQFIDLELAVLVHSSAVTTLQPTISSNVEMDLSMFRFLVRKRLTTSLCPSILSRRRDVQ